MTITIDEKKYKMEKTKMVKVITNSLYIAEKLSVCRTSNERRGKKVEKKDADTEVRKGIKKQMEVDDAMDIDSCEVNEQPVYDAITGKILDYALVKAARKEEIGYYRMMNVYTKVDRRKAYEKTGKAPIKVRWVDHNKGTDDKPMIRSRLVAKEIKVSDKPELFAATPPLEAVKMVISEAADKSGKEKCLMHNDVSRAYFHAEAVRDVFVEIIEEDAEEGDGGRCGWLNLSMYGTRDAASNWERKYGTVLMKMNFEKGKANPCVFRHKERGIETTVHGDDFFSCGALEDLRWMQRELEKDFALKTNIIGRKEGLLKQLVVLGRTVTFTEYGIKYEADKKHFKTLLADMNMGHVKTAVAPGGKAKKSDEEEEEGLRLLSETGARAYRAATARCNYLAADRPDIQFATKEVCRGMASPTEAGWDKLKHLVRYLKGRPDVVQWLR